MVLPPLPLRLPPPKLAKDAAKASQRIHPDFFQPITRQTLTQLLGLPGMVVTHFFVEEQKGHPYLHLACDHHHNVAVCPRCQQAAGSGYDHKERSVRHLDVFGMRTIIHFDKRRFDCEVCGQPFSEILSWIEPKRRQTRAYEAHIYEQAKKTPRKQVALQEGLPEATVLDIFKKKAREKQRGVEQGPIRLLGIDEISVRKGHKNYALVLTDLERRWVLEVFDNRLQETFEQWLDGLSEQQRRAIKVVSMDMWNPYRQVVRRKLPKAKIVADRFHVVKQLNHQLNLLRRKLQREADKELAEILKGCRWLLLKNRAELPPKEEKKLSLILEACPELRQVYLLKEEFRTIGNKIKDKKQAERFLLAWVYKAEATGSRYLRKFVKTLRNWWTEFLNYFDEGITQGFVEGTNRAIRGIINRAFGFRDFANFRLQVLVEHGGT
jgi:transposase